MKEGDNYNAANTNAEIDALLTDVNGLTFADNLRPRSLRKDHLPSILADDDCTDTNKGDGMDVGSVFANWPGSATGAFRHYSNVLSPDGSHPKDFQVFVALPGGIGPGSGVGWRSVCRNAVVANQCNVEWVPASPWSEYDSILVSASVCVGVWDNGGTQEVPAVASFDHCFALCLAIEDSGGNLYCVERTIRCFNVRSVAGERVSLTALLTDADLTAAAVAHGGSANARRVTLMVARFEPYKTVRPAIDGDGYIELGPHNITQLPLHHDTLS